MPTLDWIGKQAVVNHHLEVPYRLLICDASLSTGDPEAGNLLVQGDNLLALKALLPYYAGQVHCIYIDPPYNTGNEGWVYNDNVNSPEIKTWLSQIVGKEGEDLSRHDKWLCMMYPRLKLLRKFLGESGIMFVSIDDNEIHNMITILDEIFGENNFIGIFTWVRKKKGSHLSDQIRKMTEYVVAYRNKNAIELYGEDAYKDKWQPLLKRTNAEKQLSLPGNAVEATINDGVHSAGEYGRGGTKVLLQNDITVKEGKIITPFSVVGRFVWTQKKLEEELSLGTRIAINSMGFGFNVLRWDQNQKTKRPSTLINESVGVGTNEDANEEIKELFNLEGDNNVFKYSKPVSLINYLIKMATKENRNAIILDSFSGSGTTGHAVLQLNKEDGGDRRFILVEMEEDICRNVTAERLKRVINGYGDKEGLGGGFRYCKLGEPLFDEYGNIRDDVKFNDLAHHIYFSETGLPLPKNAKKNSSLIGMHDGKAYYLLFNGILGDKSNNGGNILTSKILSQLPAHNGPRIIFGEGTRIGLARLRKENITFKQIPYEIKTN